MNKPGFLRNKKTLGIFAAFALLLIGGTFAVSRDTSIFANLFRIGTYKTSATEVFNSPSNWMTCETVEKSITVKNEGSMPVAARIKIDESWVDKDGNVLPLVFTDDNGDTQNWAVIDINTTDWIKNGEYYVYKEDLAPNATTSAFMTGVTLNCDANLAGSAYSNATYTLTATIQTIDANYKSEWVTNHATLLSGARLNSKMRKLTLLGSAEEDDGEEDDEGEIPEETLASLESWENILETQSPSTPREEFLDIYSQFLDAVGQVHDNTNIKAIRSASSLPENFDTTNPDNIISTDDSTTPIYAWYDNTDDAGIIYVYSDTTIKANRNMGYSLMCLSALSDISSLADWDMSDTESVFYFFGATGNCGETSLTDISALASWNTSNMTNISWMFYGASYSLTDFSALANWDTSNVTNMSYMFENAYGLDDVSALANWDTSNVTNMSGMFYYSSLADISALANWDTSNVTNMYEMFYSASSLADISALASWDTSNVMNMGEMFYSADFTDISALANWDTSNVTNMRYMFAFANFTNVSALARWDTSNVTDMDSMFYGSTSLTDISALANWDTSSVTNMSSMFLNVNSLTDISALANWDTSNVTDMSYMFRLLESLTDISALANWDTSSVTNMDSMFYEAKSLTDISALARWDTSNVTDMSGMFRYDRSLTNISALANWDTSNATDISYMFANTNSLTDISALANWDTSSVTNMRYMFSSATPLTNISALAGWDTSNVTDMRNMFSYASNIADLSPLNDWTVNPSAKMSGMFTNIPSSVARPTWYVGN